MGEGSAMEYDQEKIFKHLYVPPEAFYSLLDTIDSYFYLDTPHNARKNGMTAASKHEDAIVKRFINYTILNDAC
jgi:hypothetical protein